MTIARPLLPFALAACLAAQTSREVPLTGRAEPLLAEVEQAMLDFMAGSGAPGASLAVARQGRLVYARGFGHADVAGKRPVEPGSLFRIASISKPITAVAILQLVEQKKLRLTDKVVDLLRPEPLAGAQVDPRLAAVTILQLLQHTGGFDRDKSFDPMFRSHAIAKAAGHEGAAGAADVIRYMAGRPLDFDPGTAYAYSNFGYCLLGRVIEKVTGKGYEEHVQAAVLRPVGAPAMRIGKSLRELAAEGEVVYYHPGKPGRSVFSTDPKTTVPWPYGAFHLEAMDSHGGWIASASDLVRFASDFDDPAHSRLLQAGSIATMVAAPPAPIGEKDGKPRKSYYACGWAVAGRTQSHSGSLPGTATRLVRRGDGIVWAVLCNTRVAAKGAPLSFAGLERALGAAFARVKEWPEGEALR